MRSRILILLVLFVTILRMSCTAQEKEAYIYFDVNSNETFKNKLDDAEFDKKVFTELDQKEKLNFIIANEYFYYTKTINSKKKLNKEEFNKIEFSSVDFLIETWKESELFAKAKVFDKIYLIKPSKNETYYYLYEVDWIDVIK